MSAHPESLSPDRFEPFSRSVAETVLRSSFWDGPAPCRGDVVVDGDQAFTVLDVAEGAGIGQWTLTCTPVRLIRWDPCEPKPG